MVIHSEHDKRRKKNPIEKLNVPWLFPMTQVGTKVRIRESWGSLHKSRILSFYLNKIHPVYHFLRFQPSVSPFRARLRDGYVAIIRKNPFPRGEMNSPLLFSPFCSSVSNVKLEFCTDRLDKNSIFTWTPTLSFPSNIP